MDPNANQQPIQPPPTTSPVELPSSNRFLRNFLIFFGIFILIAIAGAGAYFLANQNKQTPVVQTSPTDQTDPKTVTESFYNWYNNCINNHFSESDNNPSYDKPPFEACPYHLSGYLISPAKDLRAQGVDPILCAQDTPESIKVDEAIVTNNSAAVTVHTFYSISDDNPIEVGLKNIYNQWKISDIKCGQSSDSTLCIQVITPARNNSTNECREFPTPCDVPSGWTKVSSCAY